MTVVWVCTGIAVVLLIVPHQLRKWLNARDVIRVTEQEAMERRAREKERGNQEGES